jgi:DNA-directed RNA polymerase subunit M/transcription elongation factor TFIIS
VGIPRQAFLGLVEAFLSENCQLYLIVRRLVVTKVFGCDHCGASIMASSPDDQHTILSVKAEGESLERKIVCEKCKKENIRHWVKEAGHVFLTR